jgi:hypothetical protein
MLVDSRISCRVNGKIFAEHALKHIGTVQVQHHSFLTLALDEVILIPWLLHPVGNRSWYTLIRRLGGPQNLSVMFLRKEKSLAHAGI